MTGVPTRETHGWADPFRPHGTSRPPSTTARPSRRACSPRSAPATPRLATPSTSLPICPSRSGWGPDVADWAGCRRNCCQDGARW